MVDRVRTKLAMLASKGVTRGIRLAGKGGGTAYPGVVAMRIDPHLLDKLARTLPKGTVVIAGTNGKTTTSRMLATIADHDGQKVVHNRSGSNLLRGITAAFAEQLPLLGGGADLGVIEADENAFPDIVRRVRPRIVVLLNLFRDQLDRYGELETIAAHWQPTLEELPATSTLVVNADDPTLATIAEATSAQVFRFGMTAEGARPPELPHAADAGFCRRCGSLLTYDAIYVSHLGNYRCPNCGLSRPPLDLAATSVRPSGLDSQCLTVECVAGELTDYTVATPGLYNAYNALAAIATARTIGLAESSIESGLAQYQPAFGRLEHVSYKGLTFTLALAKNPTGFNELIQMVNELESLDAVLIGINDLDADGRDVSWLWDVDFEVLAGDHCDRSIIAAGLRGHDLAVRMKYAGLDLDRLDVEVAGRHYDDVLDHVVATRERGEHVFALLTYTSMLQLRQAFVDRGALRSFWEQ
ncbi:MAG: MurT ligase domain-containing protein [Chloroflexota bacterium]